MDTMRHTKPTIIRFTPLGETGFLLVAAYGSSFAVQRYKRVFPDRTILLIEHVGGAKWCLNKFAEMCAPEFTEET